MKRIFWLAAILSFAFAMPAWAKPSVSSAISPEGWRVHTIKFDGTTDDSEPFGLGPSCSVRVVTYGGSGSVSLYQVPTKDTAAASGSLVGTFSSVSTSATTFRPGQGLAKVVSTSGSDGTVMEVWCSNSEIAAGGGGASSDNDGDGLYEVAYLWDADGDGSGKVLCRAKDTPDPACKADGEVIYRDAADDLNCAMHGCGNGQMEDDGLLLLEDGVVYVNWPCWDAAEPSGFNDPTATDDNLHDQTSDAAYDHCPANPDGAGRRLATIATLDWKGTIRGGGRDMRNPATVTGYLRDRGTYLVDDRGPNHDGDGDNVWFGMDGFIRGINFGYEGSLNTTAENPSQAGAFVTDGDSKGYGTIDGNQTIEAFNGDICVADTSATGTVSADNWAQTLVAGDIVIIETSSDPNADTRNLAFAYRVRDTPAATTCNGAGTVSIPLGGKVSGGTGGDFAANPIFTDTAYDGRYVLAVRSDYFESGATIENLTIEPQDWWNEGGDCAGSGVWTSAGDSSQTDRDCDTNPLVGFWGYTAGKLKDVAVRHWHDRAVDGETGGGYPLINRTAFQFGNGGDLSDPAFGWSFREIEVLDSQFEDTIFGSFGPGFTIDSMTVARSSFDYLLNLGNQASFVTVNNVRVLSSSFSNAFRFQCGARNNVIRNLFFSGHEDAQANDQNGVVARFICADTAEPIVGNSISVVRMEGPGQATGGTGATNCAVVFDADSVEDDENIGAIRDNRFSEFNYIENGDGINVEPGLFCIQDDATTNRDTDPDFSLEEILADQVFWGNSVQTTGGSGTPRVYAICGVNDTAGNGATHRCEDPIEGSGGGGADPIGCMNFENGAIPANQSCQ